MRIRMRDGGGEKSALEALTYLEQDPDEDEIGSTNPTAVSKDARLAALLGVPEDRVPEAPAEIGKQAREGMLISQMPKEILTLKKEPALRIYLESQRIKFLKPWRNLGERFLKN